MKKKRTPTNKTEPVRISPKTGIPTETDRKGFNELASDDDGAAIRLNISNGQSDARNISGLNPNALTVAEHHKHMTNDQLMEEIKKHKEMLQAARALTGQNLEAPAVEKAHNTGIEKQLVELKLKNQNLKNTLRQIDGDD